MACTFLTAFLAVPWGPHDQITRTAAQRAGWPRRGMRRLLEAVRRPDLQEFTWRPRWRKWLRIDATSRYRPRHHADRVPSMPDGQAWEAAVLYIEAQRQAAVCAPTGPEAVAALGRALHAAQDVFSHSNLVELDGDDQQEAVQALLSCQRAPHALRLTAFAPGAPQPAAPPDPFPHARFAKDAPGHNAAATRMQGSHTTYEAARHAATEISWHLVRSFLETWPGKRRDLVPARKWPWLLMAAAALAAWRAQR